MPDADLHPDDEYENLHLLVTGLIETVITAEERVIDLEERLAAAAAIFSGHDGSSEMKG